MITPNKSRSQPPLALSVPQSRFTPRVGGGSALDGIVHIMKTFVTFFTATLILCSFPTPSFADRSVDKNLTQQISGILKECESVKPGMTRAELLKVFTTEGGMSTQIWRTFVHSRCPYIKVDVEFAPTKSGQEQTTDIITKISKPYLAWTIID
jgi:hypothetical protein